MPCHLVAVRINLTPLDVMNDLDHQRSEVLVGRFLGLLPPASGISRQLHREGGGHGAVLRGSIILLDVLQPVADESLDVNSCCPPPCQWLQSKSLSNATDVLEQVVLGLQLWEPEARNRQVQSEISEACKKLNQCGLQRGLYLEP